MATLEFRNKTLERLYRSFKWARNNSLQLFEAAQAGGVLGWALNGEEQHTMLYQFQCLVTTTDAYYRRLTENADIRFGVLVQSDRIIRKSDLAEADIQRYLKTQLTELETLLKHFDDKQFEENVRDIQSIANHEYLHQGQLVVMFRQAGAGLPERFRKAFAL